MLIMFARGLEDDVFDTPIREGGSLLHIRGLVQHMVRHTENIMNS